MRRDQGKTATAQQRERLRRLENYMADIRQMLESKITWSNDGDVVNMVPFLSPIESVADAGAISDIRSPTKFLDQVSAGIPQVRKLSRRHSENDASISSEEITRVFRSLYNQIREKLYSVSCWESNHQVLVPGVLTPGTVKEQDYKFYRFALEERSRVIIQLNAIVGDPDLYVSASIEYPSKEHHTWASAAGGSDLIEIQSKDPNLRAGAHIFVGVYGATSAEFTIRVVLAKHVELSLARAWKGSMFPGQVLYFKVKFVDRKRTCNFLINHGTTDDLEICVDAENRYPSKDSSKWNVASDTDRLSIHPTDSGFRIGWWYIGVTAYTVATLSIIPVATKYPPEVHKLAEDVIGSAEQDLSRHSRTRSPSPSSSPDKQAARRNGYSSTTFTHTAKEKLVAGALNVNRPWSSVEYLTEGAWTKIGYHRRGLDPPPPPGLHPILLQAHLSHQSVSKALTLRRLAVEHEAKEAIRKTWEPPAKHSRLNLREGLYLYSVDGPHALSEVLRRTETVETLQEEPRRAVTAEPRSRTPGSRAGSPAKGKTLNRTWASTPSLLKHRLQNAVAAESAPVLPSLGYGEDSSLGSENIMTEVITGVALSNLGVL